MMGQIMGLARSLGGGAQSDPTSESSSPDGGMPGPGATDPLSLLSSINPKFLDLAIGMMNTYRSGDDRRAALLTALRPFVREERYAKLDQAIRITKLTQIIRMALDTLRTQEGG